MKTSISYSECLCLVYIILISSSLVVETAHQGRDLFTVLRLECPSKLQVPVMSFEPYYHYYCYDYYY